MGGQDGKAGQVDGDSNNRGQTGRNPALQIIILGSGGGPLEHNVTALLVRSTSSGWNRNSIVALDAGVHMSAMARILEETQPKGLGDEIPLPHILESGPFAGLEIRSKFASSNAFFIAKNLIDTYLITHPHLDHISGFVMNTAGLPGPRPKRLAGLPATIEALKTHIFNGTIWPNLSDENNGAGLITYARLVEGGSPALGEGEEKGYMEVSDGLATKVFSVSHGHCLEKHSHRGSTTSSRISSADLSSMPPRTPGSMAASGPFSIFRTNSLGPHASVGIQEQESVCVYDSSAYFIRDSFTGREALIFGDVEPDSVSLSPRNLAIWQEAATRIANGQLGAIVIECSYDNSQTTDRLFGHLTPHYIMEEMGVLAHQVQMIRQTPAKQETTKKRKRELEEATRRMNPATARSTAAAAVPIPVDTAIFDEKNRDHDHDHPVSPKSTRPHPRISVAGLSPTSGSGSTDYGGGFNDDILIDIGSSASETVQIATPTAESSQFDASESTVDPENLAPLANGLTHTLSGLKVIIIHVKDSFTDDSESAKDRIQRELIEHEGRTNLGCEFIVSSAGDSFMI